MKKCKSCGEIGVDKLHQYLRNNKLIVNNECKLCFSKRRSKNMKGKTSNMLGKKHSEESKEKIGAGMLIALKGRTISEEHRKNISLSNKGRTLTKEHKKNMIKGLTGRKVSEETKQKIRESTIKYIEKIGFKGHPMTPCIGRNETKILNKIQEDLNINITRQFKVIGYYVDGYDEENNVVYEVNENYHYSESQIEKDKIRKNNIVKELQCKWVDIADKGIA